MKDRDLTAKEQKVIEEFDRVRPGLGEQVERDIRNPNSGYAEIVESTPYEDILLKTDDRER